MIKVSSIVFLLSHHYVGPSFFLVPLSRHGCIFCSSTLLLHGLRSSNEYASLRMLLIVLMSLSMFACLPRPRTCLCLVPLLEPLITKPVDELVPSTSTIYP